MTSATVFHAALRQVPITPVALDRFESVLEPPRGHDDGRGAEQGFSLICYLWHGTALVAVPASD